MSAALETLQFGEKWWLPINICETVLIRTVVVIFTTFLLIFGDAHDNSLYKTHYGEILVSSEGALYVILPYDYPAVQPLFEHTPVLNNNF